MRNSFSFPQRPDDAVLLVSFYEKGKVSGVLLHPRLHGPQEIESIPQLLFKLEEAMDFKDRSVDRQIFNSISSADTCTPICIRILKREGDLWQGVLICEEGQDPIPFYSILELVHALDDILSN